ncbi:MAG TPA: SgcJ/EcaC family oxidoreductase [Nitrospiria bacterium]|nr:SgcJ/EcaC family oxidoreductase [Nitrospiria bacterium]
MFAETFSAGDLNAVMALYEPGAVLVAQPGQTVRGHANIREALKGFLALKPRFVLRFGKALVSDDIALLLSTWTLHGTGPDGKAVELAGQTTDVVRRQKDGTWLLVVDNPFGIE